MTSTASQTSFQRADIRTPKLVEAHSDRRETSVEVPETEETSVVLNILSFPTVSTNEENDDLPPKPGVAFVDRRETDPEITKKKKKKPIKSVNQIPV
jgi:hypothetical protein